MKTTRGRVKMSHPTSHTYKRIDLCFIMNLRNKLTKSTMPVAELAEMVGSVTPEERELLQKYRNLPEDVFSSFQEEGWFNKTFETVKKHAEAYVKSTPGPTVIYTPTHDIGSTARIRIARLLWFYAGKGRQIPLLRIALAEEQEYVVGLNKGITVVNSGPGTGKTTTAAHKTARLSSSETPHVRGASSGMSTDETNVGEGVLVVSYTNAAVDNLMMRLLELVNNIEEISKKPGKKIWLTTIDSLSQMLLPKGQRKTDFDAQIEAAIRDSDQFASLFLTLDNKPAYQHIIFDEAQDASNERFQLLKMIYEKYHFKSFTIIGDPRQRLNIRHGGFYQELLLRGEDVSDTSGEPRVGTFARPLVVKYHHTYRFVNPLLLDLANVLSATRPSIHSQLIAGASTHEETATEETQLQSERTQLTKFSSFEQIAADIIARVQQGIKPSTICIISPVTQKASASKTKFDAIRQILASNGIMTSDQYTSEGGTIYTSSIQSVKGLEFDHVYFIGASGFPTYMNQEYQDINDGQSMNFVANTRARLTLTYLTDQSMRAPDDVPETMTVGGTARQVAYNREIYPEAIATNDIEPSEYRKFMAHNMLPVPHEEVPGSRFSTESHPENYLYEIVSASLAHTSVKGKNTIAQLGSEVVPMEDMKQRDYSRRGMLYDMRGKDGATYVANWQLPLMPTLRASGFDETTIEVHKTFRECMTGRPSTLGSMTQINDVVMKVVSLFRGASQGSVLQSVVSERIRATSIVSDTSIVVFSECLYLGALVKRRNQGKRVYLVGLTSGVIVHIGTMLRPLKQYEYMVGALFSITVQYRLIRGRGRFSLASVDQSVPWYFIDTEFTARTWLKSATIYDIAVINGFDPYASTVSYLSCDPTSFDPYLNPDVRYSDLEGAPNVDEFYAFFSHLSMRRETEEHHEVSAGGAAQSAIRKPVIWYFSATHDVSPFYEQHEHYDRARELGINGVESGAWKYEPNLNYEYAFRNARIGNTKGKMSELYEGLLKVKVSSYRHILLHTAVSDALLLAELVMTRELG